MGFLSRGETFHSVRWTQSRPRWVLSSFLTCVVSSCLGCWLSLLMDRALWMLLSCSHTAGWLMCTKLKGFCDCSPLFSPPQFLFLPTWNRIYFVREKSISEIACFINCLLTQSGWMLYSCLIYFENFATELTLINELSVVSNKLRVGYIDWEGF